ncbi:MAG: hypothetical protein V8Q30_03965 [Acutalibacteraceae bacterium]
MKIKAALYNADHLEYGLVTIPFPISRISMTTRSRCWRRWISETRGQGTARWRRSRAAPPV